MDVERSLVNGVEAQCEGPAGRDRHIKSPSFWLCWHRTTHKVRDQLAAFFSLSPRRDGVFERRVPKRIWHAVAS